MTNDTQTIPATKLSLIVKRGDETVFELKEVNNLLLAAEFESEGKAQMVSIPSGDMAWDAFALTNLQSEIIGGLMSRKMAAMQRQAKNGLVIPNGAIDPAKLRTVK